MIQPSVSVIMPILIEKKWQIPMTQCAIDTLRCTTDYPFEFIIVETGTNLFEKEADKYIHRPQKTSVSIDLNLAFKEATGDYILRTQNDIFTRPEWLEAILECFEIEDCGLATLAAAELIAEKMGRLARDHEDIQEGVYGPFMAFRNGWFFDEENFPYGFNDTDLIMRIYRNGQRMYRNWRVTIQHLNKQTTGNDTHEERLEIAKQKFIEKHQDCPFYMFRVLALGSVV